MKQFQQRGTVNKSMKFMKNLHENEPALVNKRGLLLLHENARPYVSQITTKKLNQLKIKVLLHPPSSPDLSPTDYHLFKRLDNFLTGKSFLLIKTNLKRPLLISSNPEHQILIITA